MADKENQEFLKRLLETFKIEAQEHISALSSGLIEMEKAPDAQKQLEITEVVFREAHSLKGAARAVNLADIEALCQALEDVLSALKSQKIASTTELFNLLHGAVDSLGKLLAATEGQAVSLEKSALSGLIKSLRDAATGGKIAGKDSAVRSPAQPAPEAKPAGAGGETLPRDIEPSSPTSAETLRVSIAKLNPVLLQIEELLLAKLASRQRIAELEELKSALADWIKQWQRVYPESQRLRYSLEKNEGGDVNEGFQLTRLVEFLDWNNSWIRQLEDRLTAATTLAKHDNHSVALLVDSLQEDTKRVMMFSFSTLLEAFPKMVRDLSSDRDKEVELVIRGGEVEIDRRILEEMKDPLIHLVRNCIEHGIEIPSERQRRGKPARGTITLAIAQTNSHIEILVSDDGSGVDADGVKAAAVKLGSVPAGEATKLADSEALPLIFRSGLSTSPIITDISGRGLGLAIVREKVDKVGGTVSFETQAGEGTTFRLILPMTTAEFRSVIVRVGDHLFALPTTDVERVLAVNESEIKTVENRRTIEFNGQAVSLVHLGDVLEMEKRNKAGSSESGLPAVVLHTSGTRITFLVDEVVAEDAVLVKSLGKQLTRVRNVAGATVLATGKLVLVLNIRDLMKSAVGVTVDAAGSETDSAEKEAGERPSVLVVEDSITTRTLLKNILESAGYDVATAVDGVDGFSRLKAVEFDIVLSDVDMPRMNGFGLTAKIRADKQLADLPVVLLTALESREDRERGIEVGANAYIVKSSFDQSNLLEAIRRLI